uniref:Uncharacterized protein n=1 Tax=Nelumbo nucifera TaxID=4432 RepID=A0A822YVC7_NELNU|nr:TPA_asm: hypothetical protein HUJ06_008665 [Nelumbo nucifera]
MNSDRNIIELKKNSVQIPCFPTAEGRFIPPKDVSFPHLNDQHLHAPPGKNCQVPGLLKPKRQRGSKWEARIDVLERIVW